MLFVPLVIGAMVGSRSTENVGALLALAALALSLFWLRTPVEALLGTSLFKTRNTEERRYVWSVTAGIAALAAMCLIAVFWNGKNQVLFLIGAVAAAAFAAQALVKRLGRKGRMPAQMIGAIGLTSTAAAAYCVANGGWSRTAWLLWIINFLFAAGQVHYVQVRIRSARARNRAELLRIGDVFLVGEAVLLAAMAAGWYFGFVPGLAVLAFAPILVRGVLLIARKPAALNVHRLGWTELANAAAFGILLCLAFWPH